MNKHTPSFLLLLALVVLVVDASWLSSSSSSRIPAFCGSVERRSGDKWRFSEFQERSILALRGGEAESKSEKTNDENDDEKTEEATVEESEDESDEYDTTEDDESSEEEESDEEDYYDDDETEDEAEDTVLAHQLKKKSRSQEESTQEYVEPYFISPSLQMYSTFGTILLSRKIDMFNPKVVRLIRFLFVLHLVVQQAFIFYVRVMAKRNNDRTPVHVDNPLTSMLSSQLEKQQAGGGGDMVKNLASSFLKKESTVAEYDMGKAMSMQGGILFNMALMWLLHFKMQQVQPLLVTTINGLMQLAYHPLFQIYVLGRNLERPFKTPEVFKDPRAQEDEDDEESSSNSSSTETTPSEETTEENEPETVESVDDDDGDEDESSDDEDEDENDKEEKGDAEEVEDDEEDKE